MNTVYLISGPCGCGKSKLAGELTLRINNSFLVRGDELDDCFGRKADVIWEERLRINWENIILLTRNALRSKLNVIIDYVVEEELPRLMEGLAELDFKLRYIVLTANEQMISSRLTARGDAWLIDRALFLRNKLINTEDNLPYIYDSSEADFEIEINEYLNNPRFLYNERAPRPWVMSTHIVRDRIIMTNEVRVKAIAQEDIANIVEVMKEPYMLGREERYLAYFTKCHEQNRSGERVTYVAYCGDIVAGYVNIIFRSDYPYFVDSSIPEINDLYVVPDYRKKGIGRRLINTCEEYAAKAGYQRIGLGVGLYGSYGSAQRLYTKNGYVPDGNGLMYENKQVSPGTNVFVDDELLLYLYKELK